MGQLVPASGGGNALAAYGGVNPWAEAARGVADGAYLKFNGNNGDITFGSDDEDLPVGSQLIVDMESMALGWICWDDSSVVEEILVPVVDGKAPLEHELTDHGPYSDDDDGWREAASISAVLYRYGEDDQDEAVGTKLLFKTSTGGQVRSVKKLAGQFGRTFMQHPGELPIVELTTESYMPKVKKHGKKWSIIFKIVGWISAEQAEALVHGEGDDDRDYEPEPEPKAARGKREEPAEEPRRGRREEPADEQDEQPRRGRRADPEPEDEPAPRRGRREEPADDEGEPDEAPAPRRGRREEPADEPDEAPAPRRGRREEPADEGEPDEAPAPRRGARREEPNEDEDAAPAPRGRSAGRGAPPANARLRKFD